jgi:hypothetical protein
MSGVFNNEDYNSLDGMLTPVWGPALWHVLHTISFNYPVSPTEKQKNDYRVFINSLQNVLPCGVCRKNLTENIKAVGTPSHDALRNRETFSRFIFDLHNQVNKMLNKKIEPSYEKIRDKYEDFRARCNKTKAGEAPSEQPKIEKGCIVPIYGLKSRCQINIVPQELDKKGGNGESIKVDPRCKSYKK